jgi:hypothetical protein
LKENGGTNYIKIKEELDWKSLKADTQTVGGQIVTMDGEIVPGITATERPDKFTVEV